MTDVADAATLARLTGAKTVSNVALRWIPVFLPTLERAVGASTATLTTIIGMGELGGFSTMLVGRHLDRGRERIVITIALMLVAASGVMALAGTVPAFAVAYLVLVLGVANLTVGGQAWISHRVAYRRRARAIGLFETSWAIALLAGAPLVAVLINAFGWRGPFIAVAVAASGAAVMVWFTLPASAGALAPSTPAAPALRPPITKAAWLVMIGSASTAMAGLSVFVISGSWLSDAFGVSTAGIGTIAMAFGAVELVASLGVASVTDRAGKLRSTVAGLGVLVTGLGVMLLAGDRLVIGIAGILMFLLGFEFGFVSSLSLVSEATPNARGATIAINNAVGTVARAGGAIIGGALYSGFGINGTAALSAGAATLAATCLMTSRRVESASR